MLFDDVDRVMPSIGLNKGLLSMTALAKQKISHYLGTHSGWRSKRIKIAMALRQQGWTYKVISEYLMVSPKTLMRDIKCFVINPRGLPRD